ncbi:MAG: hypothetical protein K1X72_14000 [Pyrinomonadaceae bacterium]|nr:hypothetical protein [Pyrinomonadaceae bacterium]
MKIGVVLGELCLLVFFLFKAMNTVNSVSKMYYGLAGLMAVLVIGSLLGFNNKK